MTHERTPDGEAEAGPEHDATLPDAGTVPVTAEPDESGGVAWPDEWDD